MSSLSEIKEAVATLPPRERYELVEWLSESADVAKIRQEYLKAEIQVGLDDIARGDVAPLNIEEIKRKARAGWSAAR